MNDRTPRRAVRRSALAALSMLVAVGSAGCASRHTEQASTAASGGPPNAISASPSTSSSLSPPPSLLAASLPPSAPPTLTPTTPAVLTGATTTVSATGSPPSLHFTNADANKSFVVPVGTVVDVTVQLRPGEGVSIDPPSSANPPILETLSTDTAAAATTHGVFRATAPGDTAIIVRENPAYQPCPSGVPSPCAAAAPMGFDFYITVVSAAG